MSRLYRNRDNSRPLSAASTSPVMTPSSSPFFFQTQYPPEMEAGPKAPETDRRRSRPPPHCQFPPPHLPPRPGTRKTAFLFTGTRFPLRRLVTFAAPCPTITDAPHPPIQNPSAPSVQTAANPPATSVTIRTGRNPSPTLPTTPDARTPIRFPASDHYTAGPEPTPLIPRSFLLPADRESTVPARPNRPAPSPNRAPLRPALLTAPNPRICHDTNPARKALRKCWTKRGANCGAKNVLPAERPAGPRAAAKTQRVRVEVREEKRTGCDSKSASPAARPAGEGAAGRMSIRHSREGTMPPPFRRRQRPRKP